MRAVLPFAPSALWEDFATSFAAYFMDQADLPYNDGVGGAAAIPTKIAFLDDYFDGIS